jgi:hypothetical protein
MRFISVALICFALSSCSQTEEENNSLPVYSDMGAATDLGGTK